MKTNNIASKTLLFVVITALLARNGKTLTCDSAEQENCEQCGTGGKSSQCSVCAYGYFLSQEGSCMQCLNGCAFCTVPTICLKCKPGFYKYDAELKLDGESTEATTCIICTDNCLKCKDGQGCISGKCAPGYFWIEEGCPQVAQPENMKGRTGDVDSSSCCTLCQSNCLECDGAKSCSTCKTGYFLRTSSLDDSIKECVVCSDYEMGIVGCLECDSGTKCTKCKSDYYLRNETFCAEVVEYCQGAKPDDPSLVTVSHSKIFGVLVGFVGIFGIILRI